MSADNGIYILKTKDQYRVIYAHAIENLWFSHLTDNSKELVSTRLVEYFGGTRYTRHDEAAQVVAKAMEKSYGYTEYGIQTIEVNKTWSQIIKEAKHVATLEIKAINSKKYGRWEDDIRQLEETISI